MRQRFFVGALGNEGVIDVGYGHNPCTKGNFVALELARVTVAVVIFMVTPGNIGSDQNHGLVFETLGGIHQHVVTHRGVFPHNGALLFVELARLAENLVLDAHLADVVQGGRRREIVHIFSIGNVLCEFRIFHQDFGQLLHHELGPLDVTAGFRVTVFGQSAEAGEHYLQGVSQVLGLFDDQLVEVVTLALVFQLVLDAEQHQVRREWLADIINGSQVQAGLFALGIGLCR